MNEQVGIMVGIGLLCLISAGMWIGTDKGWAAFTFLMFGLGYFGLAGLFAEVK